MANTGTTVVDFGAFPGSSDTTATVTGQASIASGSFVEAWITPTATADHTADEHWVEQIKVVAGNIVAGTGFTIYARNDNPLTGPVVEPGKANSFVSSTGGTAILVKNAQPGVFAPDGGKGTRLYGQFTVSWVWV